MEKNKSAVESFLGSLEETKNPFVDNTEDPFGKQTEEIIEEVVDEKPLPFNKDPKIQKYLEKREKEIEDRILSKVTKVEPVQDIKVDEDDDYYARLIGNDTPEKLAMIKESKARDQMLLEKAEERAFNRLSQKEQEAIQADQEAEQELETAFDNIEENFDVDITSNNPIAKKTRQDFVSFVEKIAPKDRNGDIVDYPDMQSAWETFSEMKKATATPNRAKELASRSMARSSETGNAVQPKANRSAFESTDNFLESLGK